jgi:hypothetical protein
VRFVQYLKLMITYREVVVVLLLLLVHPWSLSLSLPGIWATQTLLDCNFLDNKTKEKERENPQRKTPKNPKNTD